MTTTAFGDPFTQFEYAGWERVAHLYDGTWAGLTRLFVPPLLDAARVAPGMRVLDLACGPGYAAELAHQRGANVVGVDFSPAMVELARARYPRLEWQTGDAQALCFDDGTFDAVLMNFGLLHLAETERALSEAARVLRPGGRFAFTVWSGPEESPGARIVEDAVQAHGDLAVPVPSGPARFGFGDAEAGRASLARSGFQAGSVEVRPVTVEWLVPTADFVFDAERHAGVRTAALLDAQAPDALIAIRAAIARGVNSYRARSGFAIPYVAHVVAAAV